MIFRFVSSLLVGMVALLLSAEAAELTFEKDIRPIFRAHCFDCHGAGDKIEGELDLRLVRFITRGGESGPAIEPGSPDTSYLLQRVRDGEMPPGEHRVPAKDVETLRQWIVSGARTARPEPQTLAKGLGITFEERDYWAFHPIHRPAVPLVESSDRVRSPIDTFILARLEPAGLSFAADADKATLIRRAYLDLIGLPPTPEQVDQFLADQSEHAWLTVIEDLLNSTHYGERWGRHWLDVAGYADSEGSERDQIRPWSYKYRDWVIRAFNKDMPFDEFIIWQLAGDELTQRPFKNMSPLQIETLTATGFLRMAVDGTGSKNDDESRNQVLADTIKIVSSSLLGLSVGCAQCHDHRYDPISQIDYFRLRAVFEPAINYRNWVPPSGRRISLMTDQQIAKANSIEQEAKVKQTERAKKQNEFMESALVNELKKFPEPTRQQLESAYRTAPADRTEDQKKLLDEYPSVGKLHPGVLYQYNQKAADKLKELDKHINAIRSKKPKEEFLRALAEPVGVLPPSTKLFHRGDHRQPRFDVEPGGLTIAAAAESPFEIELNDPSLPTTGRRLAYARWLTSGRHPLLARVLVNRFWLHHFGRTFVDTPSDFGKLGSAPTHPMLLDWLADEFMAKGWSLKHLHRLIMTSTVYRQQSMPSFSARQVDSSNALYSHFPLRRLEAEVIRDCMLSVSGRLDTTQFGPPVGVASDDSGQTIVKGDRQRRSIYLQVRRTQPLAILESFDAPVMEVNCGKRESSTVATQSLMLMNSDFVLESAKALAARLENASQPLSERLILAWRLAYGRHPTADELSLVESHLVEQRELLKSRKHGTPGKQALTNFAQALLSSNEFLYVP